MQVGETLAALPGDESGTVRGAFLACHRVSAPVDIPRAAALEVDGELVPYAVAGDNATVFFSGIEANQLG